MEVNGYNIEPGANLNRANLNRANLKGANLTGAILEGADLIGVFGSAIWDESTIWPEGFTPIKRIDVYPG